MERPRARARARLQDLEDKKLKTKLTKANKLRHHAAARAARNELLLQEEAGLLEAEGIERTYHFKQHDIAKAVDVSSASKVRCPRWRRRQGPRRRLTLCTPRHAARSPGV